MSIYLSKTRQRDIDKILSNVFMATGMSYPNDGLISIVSKYGIDVAEWEFGEYSGNFFAAIKYPEKQIKKPIILINKFIPDTKKTFALAHEFGHFLLHERKGVKLWLDYDFSEDSPEISKEREANYFAGCLLMPRTEFLKQYNLLGDLDLVARYFGVSRSAVDVRLAWIKNN